MWLSLIRAGLTGLMLVLLCSPVSAHPSSAPPARNWKSGRPVRIVYCKNCFPFQFTNDQGRASGLLIDLWRLWSKKTGLKVRFIGVPWPQTLAMMKQGRADIHAGLFFSRARSRFLDFAVPLGRVNVNFFYHRSLKGLRKLADLKPHRLGILEGDHALEYVRRRLPGAKIFLYPDYDAMIAAARAGKISIIIADGPPTLHILKNKGLGDTFLVNPDRPIYGRDLLGAARQGDMALVKEIIRGMAQVTPEERSAVEKKWLPLTLAPSVATRRSALEVRLTAGEKRWLKAHPVIRVGVDPAWPPFDFIDDQGRHRGMAADYLALLGRRLGIRFQVITRVAGKPLTWNQVLVWARQRKLDLVACLTETPDRRKYLAFTNPYIRFPWVLVTLKDHPTLVSVASLYGRRVAVVKGYAIAETLGRNHPGLKLVRVNSPRAGLQAVATGRVEAYAGNLAVIAYLIQKHNLTNLKVAVPVGGRGDRLRLGVRPDWSPLVDILNKGLASISPEERAAINRRWFSLKFERGVDWGVVWRIVLLVGLVAVMILIVIFIWNRRLAREVNRRRQAENQLQSIAANVPGAIFQFMVRADGSRGFSYVSERSTDYFGLTPEQMLDDHETFRVLDEDRSRFVDTMDQAVASGGDWQFVGRMVTPRGETKWFRVAAKNSRTEGGDTVFNGIVLDVTERKKAELEYQTTEKKIRAMSEAVTDALIMIDRQGRVVFWNQAAEKLFGFTAAEAEGLDFHEMAVPADYREKAHRGIDRFARTGEGEVIGATIETTGLTRHGEEFPAEVSVSSFQVDDEWFAVGSVRDITARKRGQEELRQREAHLRALVDSSGDSIIVLDDQRKVVDCNPAFSRQFGYARQEVMGQSVALLHRDQESFEQFGRMIYPVIRDTSTWRGEWVLKRKDGSTFPVDSVTSAEKLADGSIIGFVAVIRDITEQKKAAEALRKSEENLRALVQSSVDSIITMDTERNVTDCNQAYLDMFGYTRDEIIGHSVALIHLDQKHFVDFGRAAYLEVKETGGWRGEWPYKAKDGRLIPMETAISAIRRPDGIIEGFVAILRDISERKKMENLAEIERQRIQGMLDASPIGVAISTLFDGIVRFANPRFVELFDLRVGDGVEQSFVDLKDRDHIVAGLKTGGLIADYALQAHGAGREQLDILTTCLRTEYEGQPAILGWFVDITDLKDKEKDLKARLDQLARFRHMAVGREHKMIDLKREINELLNAEGRPDKYRLVTEEEPERDVQG
jgi:PAS domain S-box-containing protein